MNKDGWNEVVNGPQTYREIADNLAIFRPVMIGWGHEATHHNIMFVMDPVVEGNMQGIHVTSQGPGARKLLFVSIMFKGGFAFKLDRTEPLHIDYVGEKLNAQGTDAVGLTELINGVIDAVNNAFT